MIRLKSVTSLQKAMERRAKAIDQGIENGLRNGAAGLRGDIRADMLRGGLGRLSKAWRMRVYGRKGSRGARAYLFVQGARTNKMIAAFGRGVTIRSKDGFWLAIPAPAAPKKGVGGKRISPATFPEDRYGPLRFIYRPRGASLLVVDSVRVGKSGRAGKQLKRGGRLKSGAYGAGVSTVVMFYLVPRVRLRKRYDVPVHVRRWSGRTAKIIALEIGRGGKRT